MEDIIQYLSDNFYKVQDKDISEKTINTLNKELKIKDSPLKDFIVTDKIDQYNIALVKNNLIKANYLFWEKDISTVDKNGKKADERENLLYNKKIWPQILMNEKNENLNFHDLEIIQQKIFDCLEERESKPVPYGVEAEKAARKETNDLERINEFIDKAITNYSEATKLSVNKKDEKDFLNKVDELSENLYQLRKNVGEYFKEYNKEEIQWNSQVKLEGLENHAIYLNSLGKTNTKEFKEILNSIKDFNEKEKNILKIRDLCLREEIHSALPSNVKGKEHKELISKLGKFVDKQEKSIKDSGKTFLYEKEEIYSINDLKNKCEEVLNHPEQSQLKNEIVIMAENIIYGEEQLKQNRIEKQEILNDIYRQCGLSFDNTLEKAFKLYPDKELFLSPEKEKEVYNEIWNNCLDKDTGKYLDARNVYILRSLKNEIPNAKNPEEIDKLYNHIYIASQIYDEQNNNKSFIREVFSR